MSPNLDRGPSTKPPSSFVAKAYINSTKEFCKDVEEAIDKAIPTGPYGPFKEVSVLGITWSNDDLGCKSFEDRLFKIFRDTYNFITQSFIIPAQSFSPTQALKNALHSFHQDAKDDNLYIIVYSGHAWMNGERLFWFGAKDHDLPLKATKPWIHWDDIQNYMRHETARIIHIFDTCTAVHAALYEGPEFLGASGFDQTASSDDCNFTSILSGVLEEFAGEPKSISQLYGQIIRTNRKIRTLGATPIHLLEKGKSSAVLHKLPGSSLPAGARTKSLDEINDSGARVLISINLCGEMPILDKKDWQKWLLSDLPPGLRSLSIQVENIEKSGSLLVIVSMPLEIWDCLPASKRAYNFISIVYRDQEDDNPRSGVSQPSPFKELRKENIPFHRRGESSEGRK